MLSVLFEEVGKPLNERDGARVRLTTVFSKLLGLQGALVTGVRFESDRLTVSVRRRGRLHACPLCKTRRRSGYDRSEREWRHVALGKWAVFLRATVYRLECPKHGVITEAVPWAAHGSRFTLDFEDLVAWIAREMNKTAVTRLLKISWASVGNIIERVVGRHLNPNRLNGLYAIGMDEISYRKGHKYLTLVANHAPGSSNPIWVSEGRSKNTATRFFDELGPERTKQLGVVTMDMAQPFIAAVREQAPQAQICFDPFHVVKLGNEALQTLRRDEVRAHKGTTYAETLKGSRWALLKNPDNLSSFDSERLSSIALPP